jgi:hypothetical protein
MHDPIVFQPPDERWARVTCVTCIQVRSFTFSFALGVGQPFVCWKKLKNFTGGNFCQKNCKRRWNCTKILMQKTLSIKVKVCANFFLRNELVYSRKSLLRAFSSGSASDCSFLSQKNFFASKFFFASKKIFLPFWPLFPFFSFFFFFL